MSVSSPDIESIVRTLIKTGESYYVEFKSAWSYGPEGKQPRDIKDVARDIGRELVAFANAEGGDLLVGVEDDGMITGIPWDGDKFRYLVQAPQHQVRDVDLGSPGLRDHGGWAAGAFVSRAGLSRGGRGHG
jgi:ATP-dependent DNA helicase RecG